MDHRNALARSLIISAAIAIAGCTTVVREPARMVYREVPAPLIESIPPMIAGSHWVPGHWVWAGRDWRWIPGHVVAVAVPPMPRVIVEEITVAPSPAHYYVRGHWRWGERDWVWVHGSWVR